MLIGTILPTTLALLLFPICILFINADSTLLSPHAAVVRNNMSLTLTCKAKYVKEWFYNGTNFLPYNIIFTHNKRRLNIYNANILNRGEYECVGWNNAKDGFFFVASFVIVKGISLASCYFFYKRIQ